MTEASSDGKEFRVVVSDATEVADDLSQLVHNGYVESGFMEPRPSGRRIIGPWLNPGTIFIITRLGHRCIAGGAVLNDGPFGLGTDNAFPDLMGEIRADSSRVIEPSALVIDPAFRKSRRRLMTIMLAALARVFSETEAGGRMVLSVSPGDARFWQSALAFEKVTTEPRDLWGAPADLLAVGRDAMIEHLRTATGRFPRELLGGMVETAPPWLTDERSGAPLDPAWFGPLVVEDPSLMQLRACGEIIGGRFPAAEAGQPAPISQ